MSNEVVAIKYANDVITGNITTGNLVYLSCKRFLDDLEANSDYYLDLDELERVIKFIGLFHHYTGSHSGNKFILEPWQQFVVANIVALRLKSNNKRKYQFSYIQVSRKCGKTAFASALCLYHLIADNEDAAEIIMAANSSEQAKLCFDMAVTLSKQIDVKNNIFRLNKQKSILHFDMNNSLLKIIANNEKALDGFNASFAVLDEYHIAPNSNIRDVIRSSMGMRDNPHLLTITTAGFNKNLPCYKLRCSCVDILNNIKQDESMFVLIYELDENDDWTDSKNWIKTNPNLGITVGYEWMKSQVNQAIINPSDEVGVRTKNLNQWVDSSKTWIPEKYIGSSSIKDFPIELEQQVCYVGVDLSSVSDLTAVSYLIPYEDLFYIETKYYLPLETVENNQLYKRWTNQGLLTVTSGNVTDYDYILNDIIKASEKYLIQSVCYDTYNATQFAISATEQGLNMQPYSQSLSSFNRPTKEMERLILDNKVRFKSNEITSFCFRNVLLKSDWNGNVKPIKDVNGNKIDGVISSIMSLSGWLLLPRYSNSI